MYLCKCTYLWACHVLYKIYYVNYTNVSSIWARCLVLVAAAFCLHYWRCLCALKRRITNVEMRKKGVLNSKGSPRVYIFQMNFITISGRILANSVTVSIQYITYNESWFSDTFLDKPFNTQHKLMSNQLIMVDCDAQTSSYSLSKSILGYKGSTVHRSTS